jgi:outer membrane receptor protein involved in Fe transport
VLYKTQLPYTPKHSGSVNLGFSWKAYTIGYNVLLSSYRYRAGEPNNSNLVKEWATQDLSVRYALPRNKNFKVQILAELNNIFDQQYEIIRYYPMPGRNFRVGISFSKKVKRNHNA